VRRSLRIPVVVGVGVDLCRGREVGVRGKGGGVDGRFYWGRWWECVLEWITGCLDAG